MQKGAITPVSFASNLSNLLQIAFSPTLVFLPQSERCEACCKIFLKRNLRVDPPLVFPSTPLKLARRNNCGPRSDHGLEIMKHFIFLGEKNLGPGELDFGSLFSFSGDGVERKYGIGA